MSRGKAGVEEVNNQLHWWHKVTVCIQYEGRSSRNFLMHQVGPLQGLLYRGGADVSQNGIGEDMSAFDVDRDS